MIRTESAYDGEDAAAVRYRKATGSALLAYADWPPLAFSFAGKVRHYRGRTFCPVCGSRLFHLSDEQAEINLSALDLAPGELLPTREGWIIRLEDWLPSIQDALEFERDTD